MFTFMHWNWMFVTMPITIGIEEIEGRMEVISTAVSIADEVSLKQISHEEMWEAAYPDLNKGYL